MARYEVGWAGCSLGVENSGPSKESKAAARIAKSAAFRQPLFLKAADIDDSSIDNKSSLPGAT